MGFGISTFVNKKPKKIKSTKPKIQTSNGYLMEFLKGLLLNLFNPALPFYWIGVVGFATEQFPEPHYYQVSFLGTILITYFTFDVLKILGARKLKPFVTPHLMQRIKQLTGIIFIGAGIYLLIKGII